MGGWCWLGCTLPVCGEGTIKTIFVLCIYNQLFDPHIKYSQCNKINITYFFLWSYIQGRTKGGGGGGPGITTDPHPIPFCNHPTAQPKKTFIVFTLGLNLSFRFAPFGVSTPEILSMIPVYM